MIVESILYDKIDKNIDRNIKNIDEFIKEESSKNVQCNVCNHRCKIADNKYGFCLTRKNRHGTLYSCNFASISSQGIDPIEKKPLYHFLPGSLSYSLGGFGCNMRCLNCQNYIISQNLVKNRKAIEIFPEKAVENAISNNCQSISWTYNEPTMYLEYTLETALLSHKKGLKNIYVSNGYMSEKALELLIPKIDAFNIDLKSMNNEFYKDICQATLDPILDNLKVIYKNKKHLEITNLLISDFNDSNELITSLTEFIANELGKKVPIHFSRFFPHYKMEDVPPTEINKLMRAKEIAIESGLKYVYLGNVPSDQSTYCPNCNELLIERNNYNTINKRKIKDNKCVNCGEKLNIVF
ncbi:AmmeMemoRadiSam system radical SAM enzyme [Methanobrevibacter sp. TMH8]|uniref:AmmeMemoRadiSam system radical SAM enzyme n=1 Tax=Methanobrevibacter sp. TMH8 TaxID=2848611 RepID=UPI001CC9F522|nr:AmmeMemoRadiSam system radical SAM enzyme [Methanobrevibacter sp. TMH8]MBZ9570463.1 AmmeMemoRadiSam system radical SAM enzyme [Methanobrevibacter sp. TMH8]